MIRRRLAERLQTVDDDTPRLDAEVQRLKGEIDNWRKPCCRPTRSRTRS